MYQVVIKHKKSGEIVKSMSAPNARIAESIERGVLINLNHKEYLVTIERGEIKQ